MPGVRERRAVGHGRFRHQNKPATRERRAPDSEQLDVCVKRRGGSEPGNASGRPDEPAFHSPQHFLRDGRGRRFLTCNQRLFQPPSLHRHDRARHRVYRPGPVRSTRRRRAVRDADHLGRWTG